MCDKSFEITETSYLSASSALYILKTLISEVRRQVRFEVNEKSFQVAYPPTKTMLDDPRTKARSFLESSCIVSELGRCS